MTLDPHPIDRTHEALVGIPVPHVEVDARAWYRKKRYLALGALGAITVLGVVATAL